MMKKLQEIQNTVNTMKNAENKPKGKHDEETDHVYQTSCVPSSECLYQEGV